MTEAVPPSALSEVSLRLLCHDDLDTVKLLCRDWFPIEYPDSWYRDITSNKKFFSLAATYQGAIVGMIVAEIKSRTKIHKEDGDILASSFSVDTQVAYILSLGVVKEFRKHGIGSLLLESLKEHISTTAQDHCKAIYLHVLTTNSAAISFYENRDFTQHHYLPYYYSIRGVLKDGFTYVLYLNGGHPPWTILYPSLIGSRPTGPIALGCLPVAFTPPVEGVVGGSIMHMGKCWAGSISGSQRQVPVFLGFTAQEGSEGLHDPMETSTGPGCFATVCTVSSAHRCEAKRAGRAHLPEPLPPWPSLPAPSFKHFWPRERSIISIVDMCDPSRAP
ncbi:N-alpha-acetyltransferase 60 isoform X1 [Suncus etruscus]|uniref:N-alpha-acetyltransferase 60 isoform X1 n=1 Tax=Suncus etruscus TaxID=109475 RepID=UPI0021106EF9|nr:N-alpha-acetyltransferase 60 isoform X1 [Suncus etruscus]